MNATAKTKKAGVVSKPVDLSALKSVREMSDKTELVKRGNAFRASPTLLFIKPHFNVRRTEQQASRTQIEAIKRSLREFIANSDRNKADKMVAPDLKPVIGEIGVFLNKDKQLQVWDGYHRTTAVLELIAEGYTIEFVPIDERDANDKEVLIAMLRSGMALNHTPLERAIGYVRLADDFGMRGVDIAEAMGVTAQRVDQLLLLGRAPSEIHDMVADGKVSADSAIETIRKHRENALQVLSELAARSQGRVGKGLTRMTMPKKVQESVYTAIRSSTEELQSKLKACKKMDGDGWKTELIAIELPAEVVAELLERQSQGA